jgi:hypothetical protein
MAIENTFLMDNGSCPRLHEQTVNSRLQEKGETERNGDWERERDTLFQDVMFPRDGAEACRRKASLWPACAFCGPWITCIVGHGFIRILSRQR